MRTPTTYVAETLPLPCASTAVSPLKTVSSLARSTGTPQAAAARTASLAEPPPRTASAASRARPEPSPPTAPTASRAPPGPSRALTRCPLPPKPKVTWVFCMGFCADFVFRVAAERTDLLRFLRDRRAAVCLHGRRALRRVPGPAGKDTTVALCAFHCLRGEQAPPLPCGPTDTRPREGAPFHTAVVAKDTAFVLRVGRSRRTTVPAASASQGRST
jgi:hypothetical protein